MQLGPVTANELQTYLLKAQGGYWRGSGWQERNFPSGNERIGQKQAFIKIGECPHTELLIKTVEIIGVNREMIVANASKFCGQHVLEVNDIGPLSGRQGTELHPDTFCERLYMVLSTISHLENFEGIPVEIKEDGSLEVTLKAPSIEEIDQLYQKLRMSVTKAHFVPVMPRVSGAIVELLNVFGQEITVGHTRWFNTLGHKGLHFIASKGCELAPKEEFSGIVS